MSSAETTRKWFDQLEGVLHAEAELAGLLGHGTMIGSAREFFVTRVLKTVLPPWLHIGTGKVLGHDGAQSNQIDVILYDPQFPVFETQPGRGLYLLEGVIAAIEIKSLLDKERLFQALDNCLSVARIAPALMAKNVTISFPEMRPTKVREFQPFWPCTYIFGYRSAITSLDTFSDHIQDWWGKSGLKYREHQLLPEVIVAGNILGLSQGRWFRLGLEGELGAWANKDPARPLHPVMTLWQVQRRFGWLLVHLLTTAAQRASDAHKLAVDRHLSVLGYWQEEMAGKVSAVIAESEEDQIPPNP
jgi:hypothetical protein